MSIENDRKRVIKARDDLSKLKIEYSKEETKIAPLQKKIITAKTAIGRTKGNAIIKAKLSEIERCNIINILDVHSYYYLLPKFPVYLIRNLIQHMIY